MKSRKLKFPRDGKAHNTIVEWWYFNGHLEDSKGNKYAFMDCLFRVNAKKSGLSFIEKVPFKNVYFSHSIFSDISKKKSYIDVHPLSIISEDSFSKKLFYVNYTFPSLGGYLNHVIEEVDKFKYRIKSEHFDLNLVSKKKPFLEGGKGFLNFGLKSSYYYALTNMDASGYINLGGKRIKVKGKSWLDRQWTNVPYSKNSKWTWFSIQLDNDIEIVVFEFITDGKKFYFGGVIDENEESYNTTKVRITPLKGKWKSNKTGAVYPVSWRIEIPSKEIDLVVKPLIKKQEVIFGAINYLENPLKVSGKTKGKRVKGQGFMELVGYPAQKSRIKVYEEGIKEIIEKDVSILKKDIKKVLHLKKRQRKSSR